MAYIFMYANGVIRTLEKLKFEIKEVNEWGSIFSNFSIDKKAMKTINLHFAERMNVSQQLHPDMDMMP